MFLTDGCPAFNYFPSLSISCNSLLLSFFLSFFFKLQPEWQEMQHLNRISESGEKHIPLMVLFLFPDQLWKKKRSFPQSRFKIHIFILAFGECHVLQILFTQPRQHKMYALSQLLMKGKLQAFLLDLTFNEPLVLKLGVVDSKTGRVPLQCFAVVCIHFVSI